MTQPTSADGRIIAEFLAANGSFISGSRLAKLLKTSRVSVWAHMEKLRAEGYEFEARPRRGYRLVGTPGTLSPAYLAAKGVTLPVFFHETIDSTNSEADRLLAQGHRPPFLIAAIAQSQGRGRLGREWFSADPGNLYLTFAFAPGLSPERMQTFTLWMGIAVCRHLTKYLSGIQLKWPNDLLADGKKLGGMLTEARIDADRIRDLVFGLGLNVNSSPAHWPGEINTTATSVAAAKGSPISLNPFAAALVHQIEEAYRHFIAAPPSPHLQDEWRRFDALNGKTIQATIGTTLVRGTAEGIDETGHLIVRQDNGKTVKLAAGDVTLETGKNRSYSPTRSKARTGRTG